MTAAELVNKASAEELAKIFWEYGGEREIAADLRKRLYTTGIGPSRRRGSWRS